MILKRVFRLYGIPPQTGVCKSYSWENILMGVVETYARNFLTESRFKVTRSFRTGYDESRGEYLEVRVLINSKRGETKVLWVNALEAQTLVSQSSGRRKQFKLLRERSRVSPRPQKR